MNPYQIYSDTKDIQYFGIIVRRTHKGHQYILEGEEKRKAFMKELEKYVSRENMCRGSVKGNQEMKCVKLFEVFAIMPDEKANLVREWAKENGYELLDANWIVKGWRV